MKFARGLYSNQDPQWESEYIDYIQLKEQLKSYHVDEKEAQRATLLLLQDSKERVESFLRQQSAIVLAATEDLINKSSTSGLRYSAAQLVLHKRCIEELSDFIMRLDLFAKVNHDIVRRILAKFVENKTFLEARDVESAQLLYNRPWLQNLAQLNTILKNVKERPISTSESQEHSIALKTVPTDSIGRIPLHYAAAYGHEGVCICILQRLGYAVCLKPDAFGSTPLLLAVLSGHTSIVRLCLSSFPSHAPVNLDKSRSPLLALAIESGHIEVAETLIELGWGLDFLGCQGQSPLYKAARRGHDGLVKLLLQASVDGNTTDTISQWTPLIVASVYGFTDSVKHLKAAGVDASRLDRRGWSAVDHASYRGYPKVVEALKSTGTWASVAEPLGTVSLQYPDANAPPTVTLDKHTRDLQSGVDTETSHIFVNLGSLDLYRTCKGIDMQPYLDKISPEKLPESDMLLEVEASGCKEKYRIHLPIMEDLTNSPWQFSTKTPDTVRLSFRLLKSICRDEHDNAVLCSALALLKSLRQGLGQGREMVSRDHTVPLVDGSGTYAGDLNFNFLVCHPFKPDSEVPIPQQMRRLEPTRVGGHRGIGKNTKSYKHLQIGENTLQAFESAMKLGADFIEFDVQVTKDFVPVIYHDFLVSETGTDATMHTLSMAQFQELSRQQSAREDDTIPQRLPWDERSRPLLHNLRRSQSLHALRESGTRCLFERMGRTFDYSMIGFKGNTRSTSIHEPFITLCELLQKLPESVHFNIELKYPMLYETDDWKMDPYHMELNLFTDTILQVLFRHGRGRHIFLSSFSPELCIMLAVKQKTYPVLFLNDSNLAPTGDPRALSLQSAIHFARRWKLQGVVMASEPFVSSPKLVKFVQKQKLFCASYGNLNDDPECAKVQADAGIDAIIVNKVNLITNVLRG